jgi:hypothetical protein
MTNEEIRIKVAEACGWKSPFNEREWLHGSGPEGEDVYGKFVGTDPCGDREQVPNYPFDLNACHEMEKVFIGADKSPNYSQYRQQLYKVCNNSPELAIRATARQRAEAFLRTLNLWKD